MNKPKIAFVIPSLNAGGAERVVTTLANELVKNYEVCIITFIHIDPFYELDKKITVHHCVENIYPSLNIFGALKSNFLLFRKINQIIKREQISMLIGFLTSANVLAVMSAKYHKIPVIISERNNPRTDVTPKIWQILRRFTYPLANYTITQTPIIQDFYEKMIPKDRLMILPNPISPELSSKRNINEVKQNVILNIGRLTEQKAQDKLIRAFALTKTENWKLVIAGEGNNRKNYESLIKELGVTDRVVLLGRVKNVGHLYNTSKIFAFSSIYEGFPNALIEAMHFSLACVSTDCPTGPSKLIQNGINGYLVPMNDVQALSSKLDILMTDEALRLSFGKKAMKTVTKYEASEVIKPWSELIDKCMHQNSAT